MLEADLRTDLENILQVPCICYDLATSSGPC